MVKQCQRNTLKLLSKRDERKISNSLKSFTNILQETGLNVSNSIILRRQKSKHSYVHLAFSSTQINSQEYLQKFNRIPLIYQQKRRFLKLSF